MKKTIETKKEKKQDNKQDMKPTANFFGTGQYFNYLNE